MQTCGQHTMLGSFCVPLATEERPQHHLSTPWTTKVAFPLKSRVLRDHLCIA